MYGETPDMSGGFGQAGVDAFAKFLEGGGTLIAAGAAVRFPIEFGWARTVDAEAITGVTAQRPVVQAEIVRPEHPVFYGYAEKTVPIKYVGGVDAARRRGRPGEPAGALRRRRLVRAERARWWAPTSCGRRRSRWTSRARYNGKGRVILFANNPIYRWQNHGEFNMVFNSLLNWSYVPAAAGR